MYIVLKAGRGDSIEIMEHQEIKPTVVNAIDSFNRRGAAFAALGCFPALTKFARFSPDGFFRNGIKGGQEVAGIGVLRVTERLNASKERSNARVDILARLMEGKDELGQPLQKDELIVETVTQLVGGSDSTGNTLCP